jgi:hypothetical protein
VLFHSVVNNIIKWRSEEKKTKKEIFRSSTDTSNDIKKTLSEIFACIKRQIVPNKKQFFLLK